VKLNFMWMLQNQEFFRMRVEAILDSARRGLYSGTRIAGFVIAYAVCVQWKKWKIYRRRSAELISLGVLLKLAHTTDWSAKSQWLMSETLGVRIALNKGCFDALGVPRLKPRANI